MCDHVIRRDFPRPDGALVERLRRLPTADLCDCLGPLALDGAIRPLGATAFAGPAFTVRTAPGDNLMVHLALELVRPGDVVVVDGAGCADRALLGSLTVNFLAARGAAAVVVDGAVRDAGELAALPIPVYARAVCPNGPTRCRGGAVNVPVTAGGQAVRPGDILLADGDGLICVPREDAEEAARLAEERVRREEALLQSIRETGAFPRPWLGSAAADAGVRYEDE